MAQIQITEVDINLLNPSIYNPRKLSEKQEKDLTESLKRFSLVDPLIVNFHPERKKKQLSANLKLRTNLFLQVCLEFFPSALNPFH